MTFAVYVGRSSSPRALSVREAQVRPFDATLGCARLRWGVAEVAVRLGPSTAPCPSRPQLSWAATFAIHAATLAIHAATLAIHAATLAIHAATLAIHAATLAIHAATLAIHAATLAIHAATLGSRAVTLIVALARRPEA